MTYKPTPTAIEFGISQALATDRPLRQLMDQLLAEARLTNVYLSSMVGEELAVEEITDDPDYTEE